ncbi:hypothetical protein GSI_02617 [Ganoderma sinense ZZ0214-1]|uniref:Uncharacterized protein n=1 Tax=Ganoderma sinense ZZ0214-1 TaxID=1077348 RepID=A0A2G8SM52_9APHY|nr:hypothetical protein GSI_02617 [Ganoderma sinense ZZ0214-1]
MNCVADPRDCPRPCRAQVATGGEPPTPIPIPIPNLASVLARPDAWTRTMNVALRYQARRARKIRVAPAEPLVTVSARPPVRLPNSFQVSSVSPSPWIRVARTCLVRLIGARGLMHMPHTQIPSTSSSAPAPAPPRVFRIHCHLLQLEGHACVPVANRPA